MSDSTKHDPARTDTMEAGLDDRTTRADTVDTHDTTVRHPVVPRLPTGLGESALLGRFHILDTLGSGGMGVVLAAYDPQLDRKVAIKVLRTRGLTPKRREREAARLLAEARAMAQLSHPNVVTVYEAGEIDARAQPGAGDASDSPGQVFIAMEYIPGSTLRAWLGERPRSVPEILDAYVKAGRGLAAGHHAGLVHRDFKPDNVLVGLDGRVRVIDFGLARPRRQADTPTGDDVEAQAFDAPTHLTTAGSLFGTPLYMAPEQHDKRELDARADQFAFCVSLYEALYRKMPFPCGSYGELAAAVLDGAVIAPDDRPDIPRRVTEAVLRGLRPEPDDRWLSMDALLDELVPRARRRRGLIVGAAAATGVVAVAATLLAVELVAGEPAAVAAPCAGGGERLAGVWDEAVAQRVEGAFRATGRSHAPDSFTRVHGLLDRYATSWIDHRREVCEATRIRQEVSEPTFDVRMQCLADRLGELRALTTLFEHADAATADKAIAAAAALPATESCLAVTPDAIPPPSAEQAAPVAALREEYAAIHALAGVDRYAESLGRAERLVERAKQVGYAPFEVLARHQLGVIQTGASKPADAERTLREALPVAARAKDDIRVANIWASLIYALRVQGRHGEAIALLPVAEVAVERAGGDPLMQSDLQYSVGGAYLEKGEYQRAIAALELARDLRVEALGEDHVDNILILNALAGAMLRSGNINVKPTLEKALALAERKLGPKHPDLALTLANLGALSQALFDFDKATEYHERALAILEEVHGPDHSMVGDVSYSLGVDANGREDYRAALPYYERAVRIFEAINPEHPNVALSLAGLADCREEVGEDPARAADEGERALALMLKRENPDRAQVAYARFALAKALWSARRDRPRALALARQARAGFVESGIAAMNGVIAVDKWFEEIKQRR